jgi:hypothetical protein
MSDADEMPRHPTQVVVSSRGPTGAELVFAGDASATQGSPRTDPRRERTSFSGCVAWLEAHGLPDVANDATGVGGKHVGAVPEDPLRRRQHPARKQVPPTQRLPRQQPRQHRRPDPASSRAATCSARARPYSEPGGSFRSKRSAVGWLVALLTWVASRPSTWLAPLSIVRRCSSAAWSSSPSSPSGSSAFASGDGNGLASRSRPPGWPSRGSAPPVKSAAVELRRRR